METESGSARPPRCGARTRGGRPCRNHPIRRRQRCRLHGGAPGTGAPRGNRNALKHGRTTAAALAARRAIMRLIRASERTLEEVAGWQSDLSSHMVGADKSIET
jgi:glucans biosynthesis protein